MRHRVSLSFYKDKIHVHIGQTERNKFQRNKKGQYSSFSFNIPGMHCVELKERKLLTFR